MESLFLPTLLAFALLVSGCSIQSLATKKVADTLAGAGTTWSSDDDPALVGDALPFSLKLMESVLAETPKHEGLLLATARGFTQYAYGWVAQEADELRDDDYAASEAAAARARSLYLRANRYAMRALEVRHPGIEARLLANPTAAVGEFRTDDVPLMYWTAAPWALAITLSKDDPETVANLPVVEALIDRAMQLDESFDGGALHSFLVSCEMNRPGIGKDEALARAKKHFDRAVELSGNQLAGPFVSYVESVSIPGENLAEFNTLVDRALAVDIDARPEWRLQNILAQRRALWLRSRVGDLFLEAAPEEPDEEEDVEEEEGVEEPSSDSTIDGGAR
ncbi:MAG: TRAP transporter TatT component family protein [Thermoanaerobaculia bacterium]